MKILGISCSPRVEGNTAALLNQALAGAKESGAEIELFTVAGKTIGPCTACGGCRETGVCIQKDDMQPLYDKLLESQGIIFGTPIYLYGMAAQCKTIIDRSRALSKPGRDLSNKVGGIVVVGGSFGNIDAVKDLYFYFATRKMLSANYISAYGIGPGDVKNLEKCMKATKDLGKLMVELVNMDFKYPLELIGPSIAYGTHTK
jgi:multimeric flavodoxin WrbA